MPVFRILDAILQIPGFARHLPFDLIFSPPGIRIRGTRQKIDHLTDCEFVLAHRHLLVARAVFSGTDRKTLWTRGQKYFSRVETR
jgi:hypothetical protein